MLCLIVWFSLCGRGRLARGFLQLIFNPELTKINFKAAGEGAGPTFIYYYLPA
jgi:hypothetical protein